MSPESARTAGAYLQGFLLGIPLFLALLRMAAVAAGAHVFRYQGF